MIGTQRWQQVKKLFHSALELRPNERASFLNEACGEDEALRQEILSLIAAHESGGTFMDAPAYEVAAELLADEGVDPLKGKLISHYRVLKKIGRGGMGEVYLAKDQKLGRSVALKILPSHLNALTDRLRRFEVEACAASGLNHPNILTIYEIGLADSSHYIATEYIEGETLRQHMPDEGMKIVEALDIAIQVASALAAAHEAGIVHRDIKPENIMVRRDGIVKVLDFGLAKLAGDALEHDEESPTRPMLKTDSGVVMGTVQYMSPEQARGLPVDARTDIWSLGVVLYEMVGGSVPFGGETSSHTIVSILEDETPPLKDLRQDAPDELEWIVMKALRKDRDGRFQTSKELLGDLKELKHKLEFKAELERSSVPAKAEKELSVSGKGSHVAERNSQNAETVRVETARTTSSYGYLTSATRRNWRWALLALAVPVFAFFAAFLGYKYLNSPRTEVSVPNTSNSGRAQGALRGRQVTSWAGLDVFPSFSPDGNSIAYSSDHNGSYEIYVKQLTPGGREIQLTSDGQQNIQPVWSPDGQRIAYHSIKRGGIWVMPSLGGAPKQLTDFGSRPAFSPDSALIAFQSRGLFDPQLNSTGVGPPSNIWVVPEAGGAPKQITKDGTPPGGHGAACWSPDGRRIVFITVQLGAIYAQLWTVNRDGSNPQPLIPNSMKRYGGFDPVYAPDGKSIYFTSGTAGGTWGLVKLPVSPETGLATGEPVMIKETGWTIYKNNQISSDGKKLISSVGDMTSNLYSIQLTAAGEAASTPQSLTQDTTFRKSSPAYSPDGKRIAYQKFAPGGNHDIWLMDADGKNETQLTTDPGSEVFPNWLPQGDKVAFLYNSTNSRDGELTLRSIDVQTGREDILFKPTLDVGFPQLSPDGKTFAFNSTENGVTNVWTMSVDDGQPKQLTFSKTPAGFPRWSPDGQFILFGTGDGTDSQLMIIPSKGGEPVQLTSGPGQRFTGGWSPDGTKISFAGYFDGVWNIWWITRDGKTQKRVTNNTKLNALFRYVSWSPLGNQMVFENLEVKGNIWITNLE